MTNAYCCEAAILATTIWRICTHMSRVRDHRGQSRRRSGQRLCPQRGFAIAGRGGGTCAPRAAVPADVGARRQRGANRLLSLLSRPARVRDPKRRLSAKCGGQAKLTREPSVPLIPTTDAPARTLTSRAARTPNRKIAYAPAVHARRRHGSKQRSQSETVPRTQHARNHHLVDQNALDESACARSTWRAESECCVASLGTSLFPVQLANFCIRGESQSLTAGVYA